MEIVQELNCKTGFYEKINTKTGKILAVKKTPGPFKNIPIFKKTEKSKRLWNTIIANKGTGKILDMNAVLR